LTPAQRKAIAELTRSTPSPLTLNVDAGDKDYVSILHYYTNASQAAGVTITYNEPVSTSVTGPSWTQTLNLTIPPASPLVFPSRDTLGLIRVDHTGRTAPPSFTRKKDAKKYASKCCVDWLVSHNQLIPNPDPTSSRENAGSYLVPSLSRALPASLKHHQTSDDDESSSSNSIRATQRVQELCHKLGFAAPTYQLSPAVASGAGVWDGEADFGRDAFLFPQGIGRVRGVYGKVNAKEMIARLVLGHLVEVQEGRKGLSKKLDYEDGVEGGVGVGDGGFS
jgi:hypothetical protein